MRTFNANLLCFFLAFFLLPACTTNTNNGGGNNGGNGGDDDNNGDVVVNNIPVDSAQSYTSKWLATVGKSSLETPIQGFTLDDIDLKELLDEDGVDSARFYLGEKPNGDLMLMVLGVDSSGNDMYDASEGQYIYDFSRPCPDDCGSLIDSE